MTQTEALLKRSLKRFRLSQPFNYLATSGVRALLRVTDSHSELAVKHLHRVGTVRCTLENGRTMRLWSLGDDWIANQVYWRGLASYDPDTAPAFFRLAARATVTLDIGAHVGFYSLLAAHANPQGKVYAFEPLPRVFERLERNVRLNRVRNVRCVASAVDRVEGSARFFHSPTLEVPSSSGLAPEIVWGAGHEVADIEVQLITMDRFLEAQGVPRVDLVKIDTETTEPRVIEGMLETLRRDHPDIVCEVLPGFGCEGELEETLRPLGYRFYHLGSEGPSARERVVPDGTNRNYLFSCATEDEVLERVSLRPRRVGGGAT